MDWKPNKKYTEDLPSSYSVETEHLRIKIHRHIDYDPDVWLVSCNDVRIVRRPLKSKKDEDAMREAVNFVTKKLKLMLSSIDNDDRF